MSFYAMLHGQNSHSDQLLSMLGMKKDDFYRFRDVFVKKQPDGELEIHVYTRAGGGNRDCNELLARDGYVDESFFVESSTGLYCDRDGNHHADCVETTHERLISHPLYVRDEDDDFDCTYATYVFRAPTVAVAEEFLDTEKRRGSEAWPETFARLDEVAKNPAIQKMLESIVKDLS